MRRQKILIIGNCVKCPFVNCITGEKEISSVEGIFCDHPSLKFKSFKDLFIKNILNIPDWCPLEDAKPETEATK